MAYKHILQFSIQTLMHLNLKPVNFFCFIFSLEENSKERGPHISGGDVLSIHSYVFEESLDERIYVFL